MDNNVLLEYATFFALGNMQKLLWTIYSKTDNHSFYGSYFWLDTNTCTEISTTFKHLFLYDFIIFHFVCSHIKSSVTTAAYENDIWKICSATFSGMAEMMVCMYRVRRHTLQRCLHSWRYVTMFLFYRVSLIVGHTIHTIVIHMAVPQCNR